MTRRPRTSAWNRWSACARSCAARSRASTGAMTRQKVKRQLLDQLDASYSFEAPSKLVEAEFNNIWAQVNRDLEAAGRTFADEETTEEEARAEYHAACRAPGASRPGSRRDRREGRRHRDGRGTAARPVRAGPPLSGEPAAGSLRVLPQQPRSAEHAARADVRGEGGRPPARPDLGDRSEGVARRTDGRRGRRDGSQAAKTAKDKAAAKSAAGEGGETGQEAAAPKKPAARKKAAKAGDAAAAEPSAGSGEAADTGGAAKGEA